MKNYYDILEVHPEAGNEVIRASYKALYSQNNPENYETDEEKSEAKKRRKHLKEAYLVLSDKRKKMKYDKYFEETGGHVEIKKVPNETILAFIAFAILIIVMGKYIIDSFFPKFAKLTGVIGNSPVLQLILAVVLLGIAIHIFWKSIKK
jgi:curved DNA-binding protein CbpA